MRILNQLVLIGFSLVTSAAFADEGKPQKLGPAAGSDVLTPEGATVADAPEGATTDTSVVPKPVSKPRRQALLDEAKTLSAPAVQRHLQDGIRRAGGEDKLLTQMDKNWFTKLFALVHAAKQTEEARLKNPALREPVATVAGTCADCDKNVGKEGNPIPAAQREPIVQIVKEIAPPPPPPPVTVPVVPAPAPATSFLNNDMLLGGVFGLAIGGLLGYMLGQKKNQNLPFFARRGQPMRPGGWPGGRGGYGGGYGGYAGGYGGTGGAYGGRFGAGGYGGGLGAPAVLPPIYSAPQYSVYGGNNVGVNSVSMFGNTPLTTSPILGGALGTGGAPSVLRPY